MENDWIGNCGCYFSCDFNSIGFLKEKRQNGSRIDDCAACSPIFVRLFKLKDSCVIERVIPGEKKIRIESMFSNKLVGL